MSSTITLGGRPALPPGPSNNVVAQTLGFHRDPLGYLRSCQEAFGDVFTLRLLTVRPTVVVADPQAVLPLQEADPESAQAGAARREVLPFAPAPSVFAGDGEGHVGPQRRIAPALTAEAMAARRPAMAEIAARHATRTPGNPPSTLPGECGERLRGLAEMGIVESARGVLWARKRQPEQIAYLAALAHERFTPPVLIEQAKAAETAGFDGICCSDHLAPWWAPGDPAPAQSGNAWVWLGAAAMVTREASLGPAVTAITYRYNPVVVAQQIATLETLAPGRAFLGVGSGEAMNEVPAGMDWPDPAENLRRLEEALTIINRLLDGETVTFEGEFFQTHDARLYTLPARRPPIYLSAFGEEAAEIAGRLSDGVWTLADPQTAPTVIAAYRRSCEAASREAGEVILQAPIAWAESDDEALRGAQEWKATMVDEHYTEPIHDPAEIQRNGREISDTKFKAMSLISADAGTHLTKIEILEQLGPTAIVFMNISGADPLGTLRLYGEEVLPRLRSE